MLSSKIKTIKESNIMDWVKNAPESFPAYIEHILPSDAGEFVFVAGRTGFGKSLLVMHMGYCLANGVPFFGFNVPQKCTVGYLAMEGGIANIKERIVKISKLYESSDNMHFDLQAPFDLLKDDYKKDMVEFFAGCDVIIIDNLRQITGGKYLKNDYASNWVQAFQEVLTDIGAVGIVTAHVNKEGGRDSALLDGDTDKLKGATEYVDSCSTALILERKKQTSGKKGQFQSVNNNHKNLFFGKTRIATIETPPIELNYDYQTANFNQVIKDQPEV